MTACGHRRIAYITAVDFAGHEYKDFGQIYTSSVRERIEGFMTACDIAGLLPSDRLIMLGATTPQATADITDKLLSRSNPPTAIIASDSVIALEIFKVVRQRGLRIPEDLSLITFHDADWTTVTSPPITVIDQPAYILGQTVAELLIRRLKGEARPPERIIVPTSIIERGSVAPPLDQDKPRTRS